MLLDQFLPRWQFHEVHSRVIAAPPERTFAAIRPVRADEIFLFRALTWVRRFGRPLPESILHAPPGESLLDVATRSGFVWLADAPPRELVIGTAVIHPPGASCGADLFRRELPPGYALAAMNFRVEPHLRGSLLTTETRVFATDPRSRRRFAIYWAVIYPGSAFIRRMWLRAVARRAEA